MMRTSQQVLDQLLEFARENELIRAMWMNGSRVNPDVKQDIFCDYDVACAVTDVQPFVQDKSWISRFGELTILQLNEFTDFGAQGCIFLMLFSDGVRIDLAFDPLETMEECLKDSLTLPLLDKDGRLPVLPPPSDYKPLKPTRKEFDEAVNEFFWCSNNVCKGIWRGELTYTKFMYDGILQDCLVKVLGWYVSARTDWQVNPGYHGKWLKLHLPSDVWARLEKTYADADEEHMWQALFTGGGLMREIGMQVAAALGYDYPLGDDQRMTVYWQKVRALPKGAEFFV